MPLVFSTLTGSVTYTKWGVSPGGLSVALKEVTIKGGANLADRRTIITPRGVGTQVSGADLDFLNTDAIFCMHKKNGFITIDSVKDIRDADLAASNMEGRDDSAPDVEQDYEEGKAPIVTNTVQIDTPPPTGSRRLRATN